MTNHPNENGDIYQSVFKFHNSGIYGILNHESLECTNLPINSNLLHFTNKLLEEKYIQTLYCDRSDRNKVSNEFKSNLLIFYVFFTLYILILVTCSLLLYNEDNLESVHLFLQLSSLLAILLIAYGILFLILTCGWFLRKSRILYTLFGLIFMIFLVVGDERILSGIYDNKFHKSYIPGSLGIVCWIIMMRTILFDSFQIIAFLSTSCLALFLGLSLGYSPLSTYAIAGEFLILLIFLTIQTIESHQIDYRTRQIFWRADKEHELYELPPQEFQSKATINSEIEVLVESCDSIKKEIKNACKVIIYNDLKTRLKGTCTEIEKVKRRIAHGKYLKEIKIEKDHFIDDDDKTFMIENFMEPQETTHAKSITRPITMTDSDKDQPKTNFPFSNYGESELEGVLSTVGRNYNFDIWFVYTSTGHSIFIVAKYLLKKWNMQTKFNISEDVSDAYFKCIENNYNHNPYHNACHAADVLHTLLFFCEYGSLYPSLGSLDILSSIIAALGHDVGHQALTNRFLVNNRDELALQYNDSSVLENMHCSKTYLIMQRPGCNIFEGLCNDDWIKARKLIVEMILDTDMSKHFEILGRWRTRALHLSDLNIEKQEDKILILAMALKCSDIGHSAKVTDLHEKWTALVCEEFFNQGDIEKARNQPVSMYCDRETTDIAKSQAGFLKNICIPLFEAWCGYLNSETLNQLVMDQLRKNLAIWVGKSRTRRSTLNGFHKTDTKSNELVRMISHSSDRLTTARNRERDELI
ncbi:CHK1_2 [Blepharisma stoltei]|uniref:Phosphodiesterase n=1 Tax=Blepharisma stoltei TaxID=1481888 RepID=A0AAU9IYL4_9CILI|nr:unnamed protein product [Blepharisma stoltei]